MKTKMAAAAVSLVFALTGCVAVVEGNGARREQTRPLHDFSALEVGHGFKADATLGSPAQVTIVADENILPWIETEVSGDQLVVRAPEGVWLRSHTPIRLTIVSPALTSVGATGGAQVTAVASPADVFRTEASGGSTLDVGAVMATSFRMQASGGSRVTPIGAAGDARLELSGGSWVGGELLTAGTVRLEASGGSTGTVYASQRVTGSLSGGSHFVVFGNATVQVDLSGGSSVQLGDE